AATAPADVAVLDEHALGLRPSLRQVLQRVDGGLRAELIRASRLAIIDRLAGAALRQDRVNRFVRALHFGGRDDGHGLVQSLIRLGGQHAGRVYVVVELKLHQRLLRLLAERAGAGGELLWR